jgi:hypothetical protein
MTISSDQLWPIAGLLRWPGSGSLDPAASFVARSGMKATPRRSRGWRSREEYLAQLPEQKR